MIALKSPREKYDWLRRVLHSKEVHTAIVCGTGGTGKTRAVNEVLTSSSGDILLWNYGGGESPRLCPALLKMADSDDDDDEDQPHRNARGMVVVRPAVDDLTRALAQEFGDRCAVAVFEPSPSTSFVHHW